MRRVVDLIRRVADNALRYPHRRLRHLLPTRPAALPHIRGLGDNLHDRVGLADQPVRHPYGGLHEHQLTPVPPWMDRHR